MLENNKIYFGFFPDYGEIGGPRPTLSFFGTPQSLAAFGSWLEELNNSKEKEILLSKVDLFTRGRFDILLRVLPEATGMKLVNDNTLEWGLSKTEMRLFADKLHDFGGGTGNAEVWDYLDCGALDEIQVVATTGEEHFPIETFE